MKVTPILAKGSDSPAQVTLAYAVRLYPTAIKSWLLGALCDLYRRQFNEQLQWCEAQPKLSMKGLAQTGTGEFAQRTKRQAIIAFKRSTKAARATKKPFTLPALKAELLPHAETQLARHAKSFDGWIHLEGTTREWQVYLPYRRHKAINQALILPGAELATSAEVFRKNGKWYCRLFVKVPIQPAQAVTAWLGTDVGARNAIVSSDGYKGRDLRPIIKHEKLKRAGQQRAGIDRSKAKSWQRQVLDQEARRLVSVALRSNAGIALEDPNRLIRWRQHAARYFAKRVTLLASISAVPVGLSNPAWTSRTCSDCGSRDTFRKKEMFRCKACGNTKHADFNAATNIRLWALPVSGRRRATKQARVA